MNGSNRNRFASGLIVGMGLTGVAALLMGQGASQPVKSASEYFVTGEDDDAHLWVREGATLRCVGHGECKTHAHDHDDHDHKDDGHKHEAPGKK